MIHLIRAMFFVAVFMLAYLSLTPDQAAANAFRPDVLDLMAPTVAGLTIPPDKVSHFFAFLVIGGLYRLSRWPVATGVMSGSIILFAFGLAIEIAQGTIDARSANAFDQLANAIGAVAGLSLGALADRIIIWARAGTGPRLLTS